ncbi:hypothetical protein QFZ74_003229 [Streptomyces sp. V3I7]|nr:hypothetical protein [Streptomyces sp. V3I7]
MKPELTTQEVPDCGLNVPARELPFAGGAWLAGNAVVEDHFFLLGGQYVVRADRRGLPHQCLVVGDLDVGGPEDCLVEGDEDQVPAGGQAGPDGGHAGWSVVVST